MDTAGSSRVRPTASARRRRREEASSSIPEIEDDPQIKVDDGDGWLSRNLHTKNTKFQEYRTEVQVLNATAIVNGYAGRDPQGGTSDWSVL